MKNKAALVTGSSKRIGKAVVEMLANQGWDIAIHYQNSADEARDLLKKIEGLGVKGFTVQCDLAVFSETERLIEQCSSAIGPISLLVNNASVFEYDDIRGFNEELWSKTMHVNLRAPLQLAKQFEAQLLDGMRGCIINMLDQKVFNLNPDFFSYTISKQSLDAATKTLALALAPKIRVCGVAPGITLVSGEQTKENFESSHTKALLGRSSEVWEIVDAVKYLINASATTGTTITVDGGQHMVPMARDVQFEN